MEPGLEPSFSAASLPLTTAPQLRELFARLVDREHMLGVFRRELPAGADRAIRVVSCRAKARYHRDFVRDGKLQVVYSVGLEAGDGPERELLLLGIAPASAEYFDASIQECARALRGHPSVAPFRDLMLYVDDLRLAVLHFPLDPALPGLAELTGSDGARLLAACLSANGRSEPIEPLHCEVRRYNPFDRAVVRVRTGLPGTAAERAYYVKVFADDRGASSHRDLVSLWFATQASSFLRVPEPLGYDPDRRLLVMAEAPGQRDLNAWIKAVEKGESLPSGVDLERLERCMETAAQALCELQGSATRPETTRTFRDEFEPLANDQDLLAVLRESRPELVALVEGLLSRLKAQAPLDELLVPSHGAFRHKQMIGDEHSLTIIDWDGFCLANPALDAATFLGRLRREPVLRPGLVPELDRMAEAFRRSFLARQPEVARHLALYEGLVLTEQALRSFRRSGESEEMAKRIRRLAAGAAERLDWAEQVETA